jgi:hypothetical protein
MLPAPMTIAEATIVLKNPLPMMIGGGEFAKPLSMEFGFNAQN